MNKVIESLAFFTSAKIIHKSMSSSVDVKYTNEKITHNFDRDRKYFLYIHIPFCHEFCTFCSFHKFKYNEKDCKEYFENLRLELQKVKDEGFDFETLYIGGGTPLIDEEELIKTIQLAKKLFSIKEVSCETTPNHIQANTLKKFVGLIDRLSIGVQTFDNQILKKISRYDKYGSSEEIQEKISKIVGILPIISLDLIFNFPEQTKEMLIKDLQIAKKLNVEQIVTYPLMSSKLTNASTLEHFKILKDSNEFNLYNTIREELSDYYANNAWGFSKSDTNFKDEYIVDNSEYIGVGSGAFTHLNNKLYVNAYNLKQYSELIKNHSNAITAKTNKFDFKEHIQYQFLVHLFGGEIDISKFNKLFNVSIEDVLRSEIFMLKMIKAIVIKNGMIYPTRFGNFITLIMMREFYVGMDKVRAKLRSSMNKS